jgi:hypothetical protein
MARGDPARAAARAQPSSSGANSGPSGPAAIIERRSRGTTSSGRAREGGWVLRFPRVRPIPPDPLTGWAGGSDPLTHVEIDFPTRDAAVRFARAQGYDYEVREPAPRRPVIGGARTFEDRPRRPVIGWLDPPAGSRPRRPVMVKRHPVAPDLAEAPSTFPAAPPLRGEASPMTA